MIRNAYESFTVEGFYRKFGSSYRNPHEAVIQRLLPLLLPDAPGSVLDLACGSGEATLVLQSRGWAVEGADPFTGDAYAKRTGQQVAPLSFEDISNGALDGRQFDLVVCSFAMHLIALSKLPRVVSQLVRVTPTLVVITPHKRPILRDEWGFKLIEERKLDRITGRRYGAHYA